MVAPSKALTRSKYCPDCEAPRPISCFGRNRQSKNGLHYYCKECAAARQRKWARDNPETVKRMRGEYLARIHEANAGRDPYE